MKDFNLPPASIDPERESAPTRFVVPRDAVTEDVWHDVVAIYFRHAYAGQYEPTEDDFLMLPAEEVWAGQQYRIGSRFSYNSKLEVTAGHRNPEGPMVGFDFFPNESLSEKEAKEAAAVQEAFRAEVDGYLQTTGRAVPDVEIPQY